MIRYFINAALLMILCSTNIWAQYDPAAKKILDATAKKFRTYNSVKADFTVAVENKDADIQEQYKGKLYMQSCSFRLETPELEQFSDGSTTWTYLKENKEIQITENTGDNAELSPAQLFTIYEDGYKYQMRPAIKVQGIVCDEIELSPQNREMPFFKVILSIATNNRQLMKAVLLNKNGTRITYEMQDFKTNVPLDKSLFFFNKNNYKGIEIVDLR